MKRIDDRTVELTDQEMLIEEIHDLLMDQGFSQGDALITLRGSRVAEGLRSPSPILDAVLTPEFADWLADLWASPPIECCFRPARPPRQPRSLAECCFWAIATL
jgi:hypothetical protein